MAIILLFMLHLSTKAFSLLLYIIILYYLQNIISLHIDQIFKTKAKYLFPKFM